MRSASGSLASGVSLSDAQMRAGTYLGGPKPPFIPAPPGCSRLRVGDRVGALTQWGANAERVCVPERYAVEVPDEFDPAEVLSLVLIYMTAYQMLHRAARAKSGEAVLVHGAAGRVGTAVLELAVPAGLRVYGTASAGTARRSSGWARWQSTIAIEDFLARVRELTGDGVDIALDPFGGAMSLRSFRALRPAEGCDLRPPEHHRARAQELAKGYRVVRGYCTHRALGMLSPRRRVFAYRIQKLRIPHQDWYREDFRALLELLRRGEIHPVWASACHCPMRVALTSCSKRMAATGKLVLVS